MSKTPSLPLEVSVFRDETKTFLKICESVNTARSLTCYMLAKNGEWEQYLALSMPDPESQTFADDYLCSESMRKNPRLFCERTEAPWCTRDVALEKWVQAEANCALTNFDIELYLGKRLPHFAYRLDSIDERIGKIQSVIADVLGPLNLYALERIEADFRYGPGATTTCRGKHVIPSRKILSQHAVTPRLYPYCKPIIGNGAWEMNHDSGLAIDSCNILTFVPKDAKTDRPICIENSLNIFVQLGIGAHIRRRLKRFGLDLDVQADVNRQHALLAQKNGYATIDLSSASDSIAYRLVQLLLPHDWFLLLDAARSPMTELPDGSRVELEKFSSMGNGYTFELETLIFYAVCRACGEVAPSVFGDDIIVEQHRANDVITTLRALGFETNERKTFLAGRFFESCGVDVHNGLNVRPFYFRKEIHDVNTHFIRILNRIRIYAHSRNCGYGCDVRLLPSWLYALSCVKPIWRKTGIPPGFGDGGIIRNFDEAAPSRARRGFEGWRCLVARQSPVRARHTIMVGAYLTSLAFGTAPGTTRTLENVRGRLTGPRLRVQLVPKWTDLGPWC